MFMSRVTVITALLLTLFGTSLSLECYRCLNVTKLQECHSTVTCSEEQVCYSKRHYTGQVLFDLGCSDKQHCGDFADTANRSLSISMDGGQTQNCYECCSKDLCNNNLCQHQHQSVCTDDESIDCSTLNSMFSICKVVDQAKKICPKFCGLCHVVDGNWSPWSSWSDCDVTCENGTQLRTRSCTNPVPQYGGLDCPGDNMEIKSCEKEMCPVHGGWSEWDDWGTCSATCGVGMQSKTRSCNNPLPDIHGHHCSGANVDFRLCYPGLCAIHGGWSEWDDWGTCSATCGVGMQSKSRSCNSPLPDIHGHPCLGANVDFRLCYPGLCANVWSEWQSWSSCNRNCGGGVRTRTRTCLNPSAFMLAGYCSGNLTQIGPCNSNKCIYTDCFDVLKNEDDPKSGVYNVTLWQSKKTIQVYCDMDTDNGGWTVFQYRYNGNIDFNRNFTEYEEGFGTLLTEFWLGLKNIQEMTSRSKTELRVDLSAADGTSAYENFYNFYLDEGSYYTLRIDRGTGKAGDDSRGFSLNSGCTFSTYDVDRHPSYLTRCATSRYGGWWYNSCTSVNLNGKYFTPGTQKSSQGIIYYSYKKYESLQMSKLMFRRYI